MEVCSLTGISFCAMTLHHLSFPNDVNLIVEMGLMLKHTSHIFFTCSKVENANIDIRNSPISQMMQQGCSCCWALISADWQVQDHEVNISSSVLHTNHLCSNHYSPRVNTCTYSLLCVLTLILYLMHTIDKLNIYYCASVAQLVSSTSVLIGLLCCVTCTCWCSCLAFFIVGRHIGSSSSLAPSLIMFQELSNVPITPI